MILLEKYIKEFLKEATSSIINPASDITGQTQHQQAASYNVNMTNIDNKEVLLKVLENVSDNCFISFVDEYDEKIPRLEISPKVLYDTPHGNYAYPLNISNLKDIIEQGRFDGADFALDRPYFHMFKKSDSVKSVEIESDGSNNYTGNFEKDLRTIVHTHIMFLSAKKLEKDNVSSIDNDITKAELDYQKSEIIKKIDRIIKRNKNMFSYNSSISFDNSGSFRKILNELIKDLCLVTRLNNKSFPAGVVKKIVDYISGLTKELALSVRNRFFNVREKKALSNFHVLYFACWMLSDMTSPTFEDADPNAYDVNKINKPQSKIRQGPIFTMLLNSIDVDFINDKGSSTLHDNEPTQAVYLNSSKKENITLIGTYNNIFEKGKGIKIEDVVDVIENNRKLSHIFSSEFFDDVDLNDSFLIFVEAQKELTSNMHSLECKLFHIQNDVFNLDISASTEKQNKYVCDIGFKKEFISKPIEEQIKLIMSNIEKIKKVTSKARYLLEFIEKYVDKDLLENKNAGVASEFSLSLDNIEEYFANYSNPDYIRQFTSAANIFLTFAILVNNMCQILKSESVA